MAGCTEEICNLEEYINVELNHFAAYLKLTQYCKSTIFQLKNSLIDISIPRSLSATLRLGLQSSTILCSPFLAQSHIQNILFISNAEKVN